MQNFQTFDLGLAGAILAKGIELETLEKTNPKKVRFVFKSNSQINQIIKDYFSDKLEVKAQTYFNAIKSLKNQIYSL